MSSRARHKLQLSDRQQHHHPHLHWCHLHCCHHHLCCCCCCHYRHHRWAEDPHQGGDVVAQDWDLLHSALFITSSEHDYNIQWKYSLWSWSRTDDRQVPSSMPRLAKSTRAAASLSSRWSVSSIWLSALKRLERCYGSFTALICLDSVIEEQRPFGAPKACISLR